MSRLLSILTILVFVSSCNNGKNIKNHFSEIQELNKILKNHSNELRWRNKPDSIAIAIPETKEIINLLTKKTKLIEIEYNNIEDSVQYLGLAYKFGNQKTDTYNYYMIYSDRKEKLSYYILYEQFSDCAKMTKINENWAFSQIQNNCN